MGVSVSGEFAVGLSAYESVRGEMAVRQYF